MTREELERLAEEEAKKRGIHPGLAKAMIEKESGWNPSAVSGAGAQGLMQLMPGTAKDLGVKNSLDPSENLQGGLDYLKQQLEEFKTPELALSAYNAGPGNVRKFGGIPKFSETQDYVPSVLARAKEYGFDPSNASVEPDNKLLKPDFESIVKNDALGGGEEAPKEKKPGLFGRIFGTYREPSTTDQYGNRKPGELKEGIGRKILSYAGPLLFGMFPNPIMAALNVGLLNQKMGQNVKDRGEDNEYQKIFEQSQKMAQPSDDIKKFRDWSKLSPQEKEQYQKMRESSVNPFSLMNMDYKRQRDELEDQRRSASEAKSSAGKQRDDETSFRKEFSSSPIVKDFNQATTGIKKIRESMSAPQQTGFNDQSLVFNYMKVLDPGSVVREGEYATAMKNASLLEGLGVKLDKIMTGQQLSPDQRKKLAQAAETQYKANQSTYTNFKDEMSQIAKDSGLDTSKVIPDYDKGGGVATHRFNPATGKIEVIQ